MKTLFLAVLFMFVVSLECNAEVMIRGKRFKNYDEFCNSPMWEDTIARAFKKEMQFHKARFDAEEAHTAALKVEAHWRSRSSISRQLDTFDKQRKLH